jgi:Ca-activated chloride channel family protein
VIRQFVQGRENDQIGLVGFSEEAVLRAPATGDYPMLLETLSDVQVAGLGDGTAIGMGLSLASFHLQSSDAAGRIIILLTDGENNAGEIWPEKAAELASRLGIRIYSIGIGREGEAYMEVEDPETGKVVTGTYVGRFDEELLKDISGLSGGRYFQASSPGTLSAIFGQIDSLEKTEKRSRTEVETVPLHGGFLVMGLILILADFLIRKGWLREVM